MSSAAASPGLLFYGDPHGQWKPLYRAVEEHRPAAVVLLGDFELDAPLRDKLAPVWDLVPAWRWIIGNHDVDSEAEYDFLFGSFPEGSLHGRCEEIAGLRVAGLGGIYKGSVWYPRISGDLAGEPAAYASRRDMLRATRRGDRWRDGLPRRHRDTIFPEDHAALGKLRADILVCHEAPTSHRNGFGAIDDLARDMRVKLVVHGHHHASYDGQTKDGIQVKGLGLAEAWMVEAVE